MIPWMRSHASARRRLLAAGCLAAVSAIVLVAAAGEGMASSGASECSVASISLAPGLHRVSASGGCNAKGKPVPSVWSYSYVTYAGETACGTRAGVGSSFVPATLGVASARVTFRVHPRTGGGAAAKTVRLKLAGSVARCGQRSKTLAVPSASAATVLPATVWARPICTKDVTPAPNAVDLSAAAPGVTVIHDPMHTYQVLGTTTREVRGQILYCSAVTPYWGYASNQFSFAYSTTSSSGSCVIANVRVGLRTRITMPSWTPTPDSAPDLPGKWNATLAGLLTHEQGHVDIATADADKMFTDLQATPPALTCGALTSAASAIFADDLAADALAQATYDADTNHGRTQTTTF